VDAASPEGRQVIDYIAKGTRTQGLRATFAPDAAVRFAGFSAARMHAVAEA
jgi:hypothetical protein